MICRGGCHCGDLSVELETQDPATLRVRACQCTFCRRHGARTTSDPAGRLRVVIAAGARPIRYRFGLGITDFLVCARCGIYVVAAMELDGRTMATVNVRTMIDQTPFTRAADPVRYDGEGEAERLARRRSAWTPTEIATA